MDSNLIRSASRRGVLGLLLGSAAMAAMPRPAAALTVNEARALIDKAVARLAAKMRRSSRA